MMMTTAKATTRLDEKFGQVYADAVTETPEGAAYDPWWERVSQKRELQWVYDRRVSLKEAADVYKQILGYNEFEPSMISDLFGEFEADLTGELDITVTPARTNSVCIYLHVNKQALRKRVEEFVRKHFSADEIDWKDADWNDDPGTLRIWWD